MTNPDHNPKPSGNIPLRYPDFVIILGSGFLFQLHWPHPRGTWDELVLDVLFGSIVPFFCYAAGYMVGKREIDREDD